MMKVCRAFYNSVDGGAGKSITGRDGKSISRINSTEDKLLSFHDGRDLM